MAPIAVMADVTLGKMLQPSSKNLDDTQRPYLRAAHIQPGGRLDLSVEAKLMWFSTLEANMLSLERGDVLVVEGGAVGRSAYLQSDMPGYGFQNALVRLRPRAETDGRFLDYALRSALSTGAISVECSTVSMPHFTAEKVSRFRVPHHAFDEQRRIADYLDRETAEIDAMDAELNHLIQTLQERELQQHQSVIDLGGHPSVGLAVLADITLGKMLDQKKNVGTPTPYIRAANITKEGAVSLDDVKTMPMTDDERTRLDLRHGDIVMIEGGDAGRVALLTQNLPDVSFQKTVLRIRPRREVVESRFLFHALRQAHRSGRIAIDHSVSTIPHFTAEKAARLSVPLPPLERQLQITSELDEQTARITEMIADANQLKSLLAERRSTLITEVVTGKKEIPA